MRWWTGIWPRGALRLLFNPRATAPLQLLFYPDGWIGQRPPWGTPPIRLFNPALRGPGNRCLTLGDVDHSSVNRKVKRETNQLKWWRSTIYHNLINQRQMKPWLSYKMFTGISFPSKKRKLGKNPSKTHVYCRHVDRKINDESQKHNVNERAVPHCVKLSLPCKSAPPLKNE